MATHPDAPRRLPSPVPVVPPDGEHDEHSDDSFKKPVFMDYTIANEPPNAPLMPRAAQSSALVLTRSTSEGSSLDSSTTTSPTFPCGTPPWLRQQRAARRARLLAAGLPVVA